MSPSNKTGRKEKDFKKQTKIHYNKKAKIFYLYN